MLSAIILLSYMYLCLQDFSLWNPLFGILGIICSVVEYKVNGVF